MLLKLKNKIDNQTPTTTRLRVKFNPQDTQEHHGESIQGFGKDLSEFEGNLSKLQTKVQGNTERDSEVSQNIEVIQKKMGNSSAVFDKSVEKFKEATASNLEQLKSLKDATAQNLQKITSNANALKVGL